jgi:curved DNA-binding protein CbpA
MAEAYITLLDDPWEILGVSQQAGDEEIRRAYLNRIKACPPSQDPEHAERIREAFDLLRDPLRRADRSVAFAEPEAPLASLLKGQSGHRAFVGPQLWLEVLKNG